MYKRQAQAGATRQTVVTEVRERFDNRLAAYQSLSNEFHALNEDVYKRQEGEQSMSKKTWIIGGVAVLAIAGATILGRSLNPVSYTHLDVYKRQGRK